MNLKIALRNAGIKYQQGQNQNEIRICCLFCEERGESKDTRYRLGINILNSRGQCFNCKWASRKAVSAIGFKLSFGDITAEGYEEKKEIIHHKLPEDFEIVDPDSRDEWHQTAYQYLVGRRISKRQIREKKIGLSLMGRYSYRIIFPVMVKGKLKGIVARSLLNQEPRYLNSAGERTLYNYPEKISKTVVLTEGIVKVLNLERFIGNGVSSVALLGHTMTEAQEELLFSQKFEELVLWPDPDVQGSKGFVELADRLSTKVQIAFPNPIPTKQVDELSIAQLDLMYQNRQPYSENLALSLVSKALMRRSA